MQLRIRADEIIEPQLTLVERPPTATPADAEEPTLTQAEIRRQMYERMARGSAMAEAEDNARRKQRWIR